MAHFVHRAFVGEPFGLHVGAAERTRRGAGANVARAAVAYVELEPVRGRIARREVARHDAGLAPVARDDAELAPVLALDDDLEQTAVERYPRRRFHLPQRLAQPLPLERFRTVVAVRVVARALQDGVGHPRAARLAHAGVVAAAAEAPQALRAFAVARERELRRLVPDVDHVETVARFAAAVHAGRQRRTAFDRAVRLDAHRVLARGAALKVDVAGAVAAQLALVRPEIADIVGELQLDAVANRAPAQRCELGHRLAHAVRLDQHLPALAGAAHGHGHAHHPGFDSGVDQHVEQIVELLEGPFGDRGVDAGRQTELARAPQRGDARVERAAHAAQLVVPVGHAVDRDAEPFEPGVLGRAQPLVVEVAPAALHRAVDPGGADRRDDLREVTAQIGLTADQRDLARAERLQIRHDLQALVRRELARAFAARARAAVPAFEIARQRDLPNDVHRAVRRPIGRGDVPIRPRRIARHAHFAWCCNFARPFTSSARADWTSEACSAGISLLRWCV